MDLAIELGCDSEIRQFRNCHPNDTRRSTMNMLQHWCDDQLRNNRVDKVIETLSDKLMAAKCVEAAFKLQGKTIAVISSQDLMKLAKAIPPDSYLELGLGLNITLNELQNIKVDNANDNRISMFLMLVEWRKTEMMNQPTLDAMVDTLSTALRYVGLNNVAHMLNGYASTKCLNVD